MKEVLSTNLKRLRNIKGFTQDELADKADISRNAYRAIEKGKSEPKVSNLQKIANALGKPIQDLITPVPKVKLINFRSNKTLSLHEKNKREQIINDFIFQLKDYNELENQLGIKRPFSLKNLIGKYKPIEMAENVRKKLNLKANEVINDICSLLESAGVKVFPIKFGLEKFYGFSVSEEKDGPAIGVNDFEKFSVERKIFTTAHELGHLLLHPDLFDIENSKENKNKEKEANLFASHFLMPQQTFSEEWDKNGSIHWVDRILHTKRKFNVSYLTVLYRLVECNKADESIWVEFHRDYKKIYNKSLASHREPNALIEDFKKKEPKGLDDVDFIVDCLSGLVRKAFEKSLISFSRAAEILRIDIMKMREMVNSWKMVG
jgi:Zn-dependent peptidase ImmA (M78 family)/DNA-binding XRE family transcriptional regulator